MEQTKKRIIYLDSDGNQTDRDHAVEAVIRVFDENGTLISHSIENVKKEAPLHDQSRLGENLPGSTSEYQGQFGENQQKKTSGSHGFRTASSAKRWICPNDETVNTGDACVICGCPRPKNLGQNENAGISPSTSAEKNSSSVPDPGGKKRLPLIVAVLALLVVAGGILIWYMKKDPAGPDASENTPAQIQEMDGYSPQHR